MIKVTRNLIVLHKDEYKPSVN